MPQTIKFKRGAEADLPVLADGEPAFTTDSHELWIGNSGTNYQIGAGGGGGGTEGPQGPPGRDGRDGADGLPGRDGTNGTNGSNGVDGLQGPPGRDGRDGIDGLPGRDGADGTTTTTIVTLDGLPGPPGIDGGPGPEGPPGPAGPTGATGATGATGPAGTLNTAVLRDEKSSGTNGGTFTSGAWRTRDLNVEHDPQGIVTLSSNQFTLGAGTWLIHAEVPGYYVAGHQAKLYNVTDAADEILGSDEYSEAMWSGVTTRSAIIGIFTIASSKTFEIRHYCGTTFATYGFGIANSLGTEVYTQVILQKLY